MSLSIRRVSVSRCSLKINVSKLFTNYATILNLLSLTLDRGSRNSSLGQPRLPLTHSCALAPFLTCSGSPPASAGQLHLQHCRRHLHHHCWRWSVRRPSPEANVGKTDRYCRLHSRPGPGSPARSLSFAPRPLNSRTRRSLHTSFTLTARHSNVFSSREVFRRESVSGGSWMLSESDWQAACFGLGKLYV